jgi:hypothetical protein
MRTTTTIIATAIDASTTDATLASLYRDAATRETNASHAKHYVTWATVRLAGRKQVDVASILPVGKGSVNNYVAYIDMWADLGFTDASITVGYPLITDSRGWFAKRKSDEYAALRTQIRATDDQDEKIRLLSQDAPGNAPKTREESFIAFLQSADKMGASEEGISLDDAQRAIVRDLLASLATYAAEPVLVAA